MSLWDRDFGGSDYVFSFNVMCSSGKKKNFQGRGGMIGLFVCLFVSSSAIF